MMRKLTLLGLFQVEICIIVTYVHEQGQLF